MWNLNMSLFLSTSFQLNGFLLSQSALVFPHLPFKLPIETQLNSITFPFVPPPPIICPVFSCCIISPKAAHCKQDTSQ